VVVSVAEPAALARQVAVTEPSVCVVLVHVTTAPSELATAAHGWAGDG